MKRKFVKTKPFLSSKVISNNKITLIENENIIKAESETAKILNSFFPNDGKYLKIPRFNMNDSIC